MKIWAVLGTIGLLLLGVAVPRADAGIGGGNTPTWPATAQVGSTFSASITIVNTSTTPNDTESVKLVPTGSVTAPLTLTPACADTSGGGHCLPPNLDPGVFTVLSASGDAATAPCAGFTFAISAPDPASGEVKLTPNNTITLGPANGPAADRTCKVNLSLHVEKVPANPSGGVAGRTDPVSFVGLQGVSSQLFGSASGSATIVISSQPTPPPPTPVPPPTPPCGLPGSPSCIPTLSEWVMIMLAGFIVLVGAIAVRRRTT